MLQTLNILLMSEVIVVRLDLALSKYDFIDVYKVAEKFPLQISIFGSSYMPLNSSNSQKPHNFQTKLRRTDLQGVELRCALVV